MARLLMAALARAIGLDWFGRDWLMDDSMAASLLNGYMRAHGYEYVEPLDPGVVRNKKVLQHLMRGR